MTIHFSYNLLELKKKKKTPLIAQLVKNLPAVQEAPVQFLDKEDPLEKG